MHPVKLQCKRYRMRAFHHCRSGFMKAWGLPIWKVISLGVFIAAVLIIADYPNTRDMLAYAVSHFVNLERTRLTDPEYILSRRKYEQDNNSVGNRTPLFLGDSLTLGLHLTHAGFANALNRAIEGDTTIGILERLEDNVESVESDCVFLMVGYNDLKFRSNNQILVNLDAIIDRLQAERLIVQSILPIDSRRRWFNRRIVDLNAMIWSRYRESRKVMLMDLYSEFKDPKMLGIRQSFTLDGVHLNRDGYHLWETSIQNFYNTRCK